MANNKKKFQELTPQGQTRRLNKYDKERQERGTQEFLVRVAKEVKIKDIKNGAKQAIIRLAKKTPGQTDEFFTATAYIGHGKSELESFYTNLEVGQLLSAEIKMENGYYNIYRLMDRSYADNRKNNPNAGGDGPRINKPNAANEPELDVA